MYKYIYYSNKLNQLFTLPIKPPKPKVDEVAVYDLVVKNRKGHVVKVLDRKVVYIGVV